MIKINAKTYIFTLPLFVLLVLYPLFISDPVYQDIFIMFCLMAGLAGAWNISGGYGGQFSIGHAGFFGIGAYVSTLLYLHSFAAVFVLPCFLLPNSHLLQ